MRLFNVAFLSNKIYVFIISFIIYTYSLYSIFINRTIVPTESEQNVFDIRTTYMYYLKNNRWSK